MGLKPLLPPENRSNGKSKCKGQYGDSGFARMTTKTNAGVPPLRAGRYSRSALRSG